MVRLATPVTLYQVVIIPLIIVSGCHETMTGVETRLSKIVLGI